MTLVAKVLLGTLSGITVAGVGTGIAVPVVLASREGVKSVAKENQPQGPDPKECFVIPTADNQQQKQLLMCEVKEAETTGRSDQNYWYLEKGSAKSTKVTKISKKGEGLEIILEDDLALSPVTLKVAGGDWGGIQDNTDLSSVCILVKEPDVKWQCLVGNGVDISLTKFSEG